MQPDAKCRSCQAPVRWVITAKGKRMPMDPTPVPDGNLWIDHIEGGMPVVNAVLTPDQVPPNVVFRYVSHFVTCPDSKQWRVRGMEP